jgi:hypothetical protein
MIVMSCGIAILGLLQNSAAVIIGATVISPVMAPIVAFGVSLCVLDFQRTRRSLFALGVGMVLALTIAIDIVLIFPRRDHRATSLASYDRRSQRRPERKTGLTRLRRVETRPQTVVGPSSADRDPLPRVTGV